jgi:quercetin dioxygenase-like cupin family protein
MDRLRIVLGFIVSAIMIASSLAHSILGWKSLSAQLARAQAPPGLIAGLALGWHLGGAAMFTFGCIVLFLFARFAKDRSTSLSPALIIALLYVAFGAWAIATSHKPFFLIFVIPGLLLVLASWRPTGRSLRSTGGAMGLLFLLLLGSASVFAVDDRIKVDNDVVRILKVVDAPHNKSALHRHELNRVMIYLDSGDITITNEDGRKDEQHWKAGQVAWSPADGLHTSENVSVAPIRIVEIELKKAAPAALPIRRSELDPVSIDPRHNILLFENGQVRVFRSWREPGATEPMHEHSGAGRAAILLTDIDASLKSADGAVIKLQGSAGDVFWSSAVTHAATNLGPKQFDMVVVEVK